LTYSLFVAISTQARKTAQRQLQSSRQRRFWQPQYNLSGLVFWRHIRPVKTNLDVFNPTFSRWIKNNARSHAHAIL